MGDGIKVISAEEASIAQKLRGHFKPYTHW
jgi:hypothetical protein